jgi:hypothetical protein
MAISIDWGSRVINVPRADMALVQSDPFEVRQLNIDTFRLALKSLEDSEEGMAFPDTHRHTTQVTLGGVTFARMVELINGYTVTFEDGQYAVNLVGANSNIGDRVNLNQVSIRTANSAGLVVTSSGGEPIDLSGIPAAVWGHQAATDLTDDVSAVPEAVRVIMQPSVTAIRSDILSVVPALRSDINGAVTTLQGDIDGAVTTLQGDVADLPASVWAEPAAAALLADAEFVKHIEGGRWRIAGNEMIFYRADNVTEVARFTLTYDAGGAPVERTRS